jgi:hypothetical protein
VELTHRLSQTYLIAEVEDRNILASKISSAAEISTTSTRLRWCTRSGRQLLEENSHL